MTPVTTGPGTGAPDRTRPRTGRRSPATSPPRPSARGQHHPPRPGPGPQPGRPPPGLLDLTLPWTTLAGLSRQPGHLGRLGPITPAQACQLAAHAATRPGTDWRIILTTPAGHALAITRIPRTPPAAPPATAPPATAPAATAAGPRHPRDPAGRPDHPHHPPAHPGHHPRPRPRQHRDPRPRPTAAATAAAHATAQAAADTAAGGCAHTTATPSYRPPPRLHEYITARDLTCRQPTCRQPAWRTDLDHTRPYAQGGPTCRCNLGGFCRHDHILKHTPGWHVTQPAPGTFHWTTPTGRTYLTTPDTHPI